MRVGLGRVKFGSFSYLCYLFSDVITGVHGAEYGSVDAQLRSLRRLCSSFSLFCRWWFRKKVVVRRVLSVFLRGSGRRRSGVVCTRVCGGSLLGRRFELFPIGAHLGV